MNKNRYIIAGCVLFLLILAVFFLKQVKRGERKIPFNDAIRVEAVSVWEKLPYISIQDETVLDRYLKELTIHDEKGLLSAEQKELLLKSFKELLYAYSKGTWEDFAKVRFPEGSSYQQNARRNHFSEDRICAGRESKRRYPRRWEREFWCCSWPR